MRLVIQRMLVGERRRTAREPGDRGPAAPDPRRGSGSRRYWYPQAGRPMGAWIRDTRPERTGPSSRERIRALYRQSGRAGWASVVVALCLVAVMWRFVPSRLLLAWLRP